MTPATTIDTRKITPLALKLIGRTGYEAMERFYADPDNRRRFEEWQKAIEKGGKQNGRVSF